MSKLAMITCAGIRESYAARACIPSARGTTGTGRSEMKTRCRSDRGDTQFFFRSELIPHDAGRKCRRLTAFRCLCSLHAKLSRYGRRTGLRWSGSPERSLFKIAEHPRSGNEAGPATDFN
jgi:hypothetical protein